MNSSLIINQELNQLLDTSEQNSQYSVIAITKDSNLAKKLPDILVTCGYDYKIENCDDCTIVYRKYPQ